ncbi:MAG: hypothetical protein A3F09_03950 [Chlamydiae bacterium RIFCSPHIGHO2_12_FULL_49_11]|nr:MAG: hypothetical protein A3F09_03950 [Chlamydiae bacterium RIFCSPHIGHO2_12_FULL_49_11]
MECAFGLTCSRGPVNLEEVGFYRDFIRDDVEGVIRWLEKATKPEDLPGLTAVVYEIAHRYLNEIARVNSQMVLTLLNKKAFNALTLSKPLFFQEKVSGVTLIHCLSRDTDVRIIKAVINILNFDRSCSVGMSRVVNAADEDGYTPLHHAALRGGRGVVECLLQTGAMKSLKALTAQGDSVFHTAMAGTNPDGVLQQLLCKEGYELLDHENRYKQTPLHYATRSGYLEGVKLLVEHRASINTHDVFGNTPLHYAVIHSRLAAAEYLMNLAAISASLERRNANGCTPRDEARRHMAERYPLQNRIEIMKLFDGNYQSPSPPSTVLCTML